MKANTKILFALIIGLLLLNTSHGQTTEQNVKVTNLEGLEGTLYIGWYNSPTDFRINDKAVYRAEIEVGNQSEETIPFSNIPPGTYAIAVFLDENGNYELEKNIFGIPTEKYGFSNNTLPTFRPATYHESAFTVNPGETNISIELK